jgi:AraC family transcriptional regulator of adaptative response/methylated-DNA-[protein]-cysteine methyltransferase
MGYFDSVIGAMRRGIFYWSRSEGTAANGSNPISYLIPCHRVIRRSGVIGGYHWGPSRKLALTSWEAAQSRVLYV